MIRRSVMLWNRGGLSPRRFCRTGPTIEVTPQVRQKNALTAIALVAAIGGIYYLAFSKMREETDIIKEIKK